jgi:hypothetical protein
LGLGMRPNIPGERYFEQSIEGGVWKAPGAAPLLKAAPLEEICAAVETARLLDEVAAFVRSMSFSTSIKRMR